MKKVLVFQHSFMEHLGTLEQEMRSQGLEPEVLHTYKGAKFPLPDEIKDYAAVVSLGGDMSAYDSHKHPILGRELELLQTALRQKKPILGVCLGAQLLAKAAGARVYKGPTPEIGWGWIHLDDWFAKRNPLTFQLDQQNQHVVFHWHGDTFDIPVEGYRLAWNDNYPVQMFCYQGNAFGVQFHFEMTEEMIKEWIEHERPKLVAQKIDPDKILEETPQQVANLKKLCHRFVYGFASLLREETRRAV